MGASSNLLQQHGKITTFNGGGLIGKVNPADKVARSCYVIARIVNGLPAAPGSTDRWTTPRVPR